LASDFPSLGPFASCKQKDPLALPEERSVPFAKKEITVAHKKCLFFFRAFGKRVNVHKEVLRTGKTRVIW
jgi:hypothetical protein